MIVFLCDFELLWQCVNPSPFQNKLSLQVSSDLWKVRVSFGWTFTERPGFINFIWVKFSHISVFKISIPEVPIKNNCYRVTRTIDTEHVTIKHDTTIHWRYELNWMFINMISSDLRNKSGNVLSLTPVRLTPVTICLDLYLCKWFYLYCVYFNVISSVFLWTHFIFRL